MLDWKKLLDQVRPREVAGSMTNMDTGTGRTEMERDYDRILFSAPTRRLADKTQVFPMEDHDSVRTRLTHSHEVSNLARGIGVRLAFEYADDVFGSLHEELQVKRNVPACLAAIGLAHDLGNPPFGHQGELAIRQWFSSVVDSKDEQNDFQSFDGNAQTFRLLTRLQILNDQHGLNLTFGTLAALLKYPSVYGSKNMGGYKKSGVFKSEEEIARIVWQRTGLEEGQRHPFAYIMEACDDIAYSVVDTEDVVKKGYASYYDLINFLKAEGQGDPVISKVVTKAQEKHDEYRSEKLSPKELNDISMQMFRVKAISELIDSATKVFVDISDQIMNETISEGFELIDNSPGAMLCTVLQDFAFKMGFRHREVLKLELQGHNYIQGMMAYLWGAVQSEESEEKPFERYVFGEISENYRRVFYSTTGNANQLYHKCQLVADAISGMTESYLVRKYHEYSDLMRKG